VIVGSKGDWAKRGWERSGPGTVDKPRFVEAFNPKLAVMYYKVQIPGWRDTNFSRLCLDVLACQNTVFHVDDMDGVATANQIADGMSQLWTTGGAINCPCSACHQWTTSLPRVIKGQAENWAVFRMSDPKDLDAAAAYTGTPEMRPVDKGGIQLPPYWWWYWHVDMDNGAVLQRPIPKQA
jgi:hypothetical protein